MGSLGLVTEAFCKALPKAELHAHLNGSVPLNTLLELAKEQGKELSSKAFMWGDRGDRTMAECFEVFDAVYQLTQHDETIYRITKDVIKSFAEDNVKYLELRTTLKANEATNRTRESYLQAVLKGVSECNADSSMDIQTRTLVSIDRRLPLENAEESVDLAIKYKEQGVVGLDWCGNPEIGQFSTFEPVFKRGRDSGLKITLHFAEVSEPQNVKEIIAFRPERVGHATFLSQENIEALKENPIPFEICFTSNLYSESVTGPAAHHFGEYFPLGYPMAISTDDKGVFGSELSNEYFLLAKTFELNQNQLEALARSSFSLAFDYHPYSLCN